MTFDSIKAQITSRLKIKSSDTESLTRIDALINQVNREVTAGLGMALTRRTTIPLTATIGSALITISACEKVERVQDAARNPATLDEITFLEMRERSSPASDTVTAWAEESRTDDTVTIRCDVQFQTAKNLSADIWTTATELSGSLQPAFPASFHDILVHGVLVQEYLRAEKPTLADREEKKYEYRMSQLRNWNAISAVKITRQGQVESGGSSGATGGGGSTTPGSTSYTQTGLITFDRDPSAPFAVSASSAKVTNLDADKLDGLDSAAFASASGLATHIADTANPHATTKTQVGLGNVANVDTTNAANISSGLLPDARIPGLTTDGASKILNLAFKAAQSASADANTLDDYEEGAWTPEFNGAGGQSGQAYTTQVGRYVKVGKLVHLEGQIVLSTLGTITGALRIAGFPFTTAGVAAFNIGFHTGLTATVVWLGGYVEASTLFANIYLKTAAATGVTAGAQADLSATTNIVFSCTYVASA